MVLLGGEGEVLVSSGDKGEVLVSFKEGRGVIL